MRKKNAELQQAYVNKNQVQTNVHSESDFLREQCERNYREMKERYAIDMKMREKQIQSDLQSGFDKRAEVLKKELEAKQAETVRMMMQMQNEANARQVQLTQKLTELKRKSVEQPPAPVEVRRPQGLLTSLLNPITNLVDGLLPVDGLLGGLLGGGGGGGLLG